MQIRALGVDELEATRDLTARAFGYIPDARWETAKRRSRAAAEAGRLLGGFEGDRLVASARIIDFTQWWHGRPVSMGGMSGVMVAPEDRGRGAGRQLMTAALDHCAAFGHVISALFPATTPLYRSLGWEHAGAQHWVELPTEGLRTIASGGRSGPVGRGEAEPVPLRRAGPDDAAEVVGTIRRLHAAALDSGPLDLGEEYTRSSLEDDQTYCYLAADGVLDYRWADGNDAYEVNTLVAGSERTLRALWAIVGSGSSMVTTVRASVAPDDPVLWLTRERSSEQLRREQWMLRVVDAPGAIAARGFPAGVSAEVPLSIDDPLRPGNSGGRLLTVSEGRGRLTAAGEDPAAVRLGACGLSALYAGVRATTLRRAGLLTGGTPAADELLTAAFAATPFMYDYF
ncbi:MAG: GNAT family N-acetyltransferase [Actinomadura sp.]